MESKTAFLNFSLVAALTIAALTCGVIAASEGQIVPAIYAFGDSLADVGNNNYLLNVSGAFKANYPYNGIDFPGGIATGRFSNGYNGVDYVAIILGFKQSPPPFLSFENEADMLKGANFASGASGILDSTGPTVIPFSGQIKSFEKVVSALVKYKGEEAAHTLLSKSVFIITSGSNDIFNFYSTFGLQNKTRNNQFIDSLIDKFEEHLTTLHKLGARKYAIWGLSRIGCIPVVRNANPTGECIEELNDISRQFNMAAKPRLHRLSSTLNGMKYSYGNLYYMNSLVVADPKQYGFKDIESACCGSGKYNGASACTLNATYCQNREDHFFWDRYHPTQTTSKMVIVRTYNGSSRFATPINLKELAESVDHN